MFSFISFFSHLFQIFHVDLMRCLRRVFYFILLSIYFPLNSRFTLHFTFLREIKSDKLNVCLLSQEVFFYDIHSTQTFSEGERKTFL